MSPRRYEPWMVAVLSVVMLTVSGCGDAGPTITAPPRATASSAPTCDASQLSLGLVPTPGGPGPAFQSSWILITNTGSSNCTLDGYPKITYFPALPPGFDAIDEHFAAEPITIEHGQSASFSVSALFASPFASTGVGTRREKVVVSLPGANMGLEYTTTFVLSLPSNGSIGPVVHGYETGAGPGSPNPALDPDPHSIIDLKTTPVPWGS